MKLLIVDDEELTREGLISSIDWKSLGIDKIYQADDGINGLSIARHEKPELILCDVRMPRMDGIQMIEKIQEFHPDTIAIFMSGYSDKEYLKAAIKLKAISYVEKPLNPLEIQEAILEGKKRYAELMTTHRGEAVQSLETASRLGMLLTYPYEQNPSLIAELASSLPSPLHTGLCFTTVIVKFYPRVGFLPFSMEALYDSFQNFLEKLHLNMLHVDKHLQYQVYHLYGNREPSRSTLEYMTATLKDLYSPLGTFFIAVGDTVAGFENVYHSYSQAVILIQNSFFFDSGEVFFQGSSENRGSVEGLPLDTADRFQTALVSKDRDQALFLLNKVFSHYYRKRSVLIDQVKDLYYRLFTAIREGRQSLKLSSTEFSSGKESISSFLEQCCTLKELHEALLAKVEGLFEDLETYVPENTTIFLIKDYISRHFETETLSVKDISEHVHLSTSYVCTFFKNETGKTLNQYLTEYRIEKAKQLLADPRYKISEISSKVGYSDGNYFGKSFKKLVGLSPSEFRENLS